MAFRRRAERPALESLWRQLRLYTTAAFRSINAPLRDRNPERPPHRLPVTVNYIRDAIGKLRAVEAKEGDHVSL